MWNQDERWKALEERFLAAREEGCDRLRPLIDSALLRCSVYTSVLLTRQFPVDDSIFNEIEEVVFSLGPKIGACPERLPEYVHTVIQLRIAVKWQSRGWDMNAQATRDRMYRILYGSRTAIEEVMHQSMDHIPEIVHSVDEPSAVIYSYHEEAPRHLHSFHAAMIIPAISPTLPLLMWIRQPAGCPSLNHILSRGWPLLHRMST